MTRSSSRTLTTQNDVKLYPTDSIKLSDNCLEKLKEICSDGSFLRLLVEGGGCSGFQYKFEIDSKLNSDDLTFGQKDAKLVVDNTSMEFCSGSTIDYTKELIRSGFSVTKNPKAEQGCSCGVSFALKMD